MRTAVARDKLARLEDYQCGAILAVAKHVRVNDEEGIEYCGFATEDRSVLLLPDEEYLSR